MQQRSGVRNPRDTSRLLVPDAWHAELVILALTSKLARSRHSRNDVAEPTSRTQVLDVGYETYLETHAWAGFEVQHFINTTD